MRFPDVKVNPLYTAQLSPAVEEMEAPRGGGTCSELQLNQEVGLRFEPKSFNLQGKFKMHFLSTCQYQVECQVLWAEKPRRHDPGARDTHHLVRSQTKKLGETRAGYCYSAVMGCAQREVWGPRVCLGENEKASQLPVGSEGGAQVC